MEVFCKSGVKGTSEKRDTCVYRAASEQGEVGRGEVKKAHPEAHLEKAANVLRTQTATPVTKVDTLRVNMLTGRETPRV